MEKKYPIESDARQTPPSFDEMVGLIENNLKDYLKQSKAFNHNEIEQAWQRYKTLNHLYHPPADAESGKETPVLDEKANAFYEQYCIDEGIEYRYKDAATFCFGYATAELNKEMKAAPQGPVWVKASEFKYEVGVAYNAKDSKSRGAGHFQKDGYFIWGDSSISFPEDQKDLLILDESGEKEVKPEAQKDGRSIDFMDY